MTSKPAEASTPTEALTPAEALSPTEASNPAATRVLHNFGSHLIEELAPRFAELEFVEIPTEGDLPQGLTGDVLVTSTLGSLNLSEILTRGIKWIHVLGTGVDRFPLHLLKNQILSCSRGASALPISEWVLAHMLALVKRIPEVWLDEKPPSWFIPQENAGTLDGQRLAIVGLGAIATETARRALAFGMEVVALRRTQQAAPLSQIEVVTSLDELLPGADVVLLACALTPQTRELADQAFFEKCQAGVHFLNVARGELVDEVALRQALDNGTVARASLDTASGEPLPVEHWLYSHPQVRLTPHISWSEPNALARLYQDFEDNLSRWVLGQPLKGVVDQQAGY